MGWPVSQPSDMLNARLGVIGDAECDPESADCTVNFFGWPFRSETRNYRVIDTDYENFSIVYDCNR